MVKTEAPAYAKAAGNSYSLHLPLARLSSTLQDLIYLTSLLQNPEAATIREERGCQRLI